MGFKFTKTEIILCFCLSIDLIQLCILKIHICNCVLYPSYLFYMIKIWIKYITIITYLNNCVMWKSFLIYQKIDSFFDDNGEGLDLQPMRKGRSLFRIHPNDSCLITNRIILFLFHGTDKWIQYFFQFSIPLRIFDSRLIFHDYTEAIWMHTPPESYRMYYKILWYNIHVKGIWESCISLI